MLVTFIFPLNPNSEILIPIINPLIFLWHFLCTVEDNHPHCLPDSVTEYWQIFSPRVWGGDLDQVITLRHKGEVRANLTFPGFPCFIAVLSIAIASSTPALSNQSSTEAHCRQVRVALKAQAHMRGAWCQSCGPEADRPGVVLPFRGLQQ